MLVLLLWLLLGLVTTACGQRAGQLRDYPVAGDSILYLDSGGRGGGGCGSSGGWGRWAASNPEHGLRLNATIPGDIITDLQTAGHIPDPYYNVTWRDPRFVQLWVCVIAPQC